MKSLHNILEGILDQDFDVNIISLKELIKTVYTKRMTKKQWDELERSIEISFERVTGSDCAQDYFGTIEVFSKHNEIDIHYRPTGERARGFGAKRNSMEIEKGNIKCSGNGCHWLLKPAYLIPDTDENLKLLEKVYANEKP